MKDRDGLIASLHEVQERSGANWIPPEDRLRLCRDYGISRAELRGVASYYSMFSLTPRGRHLVRLCASPVCRMAGSLDLLACLEEATGVKAGGRDPHGAFSLETVQCLGRCASAPSMMVDGRLYGGLRPEEALRIVLALREDLPGPGSGAEAPALARRIDGGAEAGSGPQPQLGRAAVSLRHAALPDPLDLQAYLSAGGFKGLAAALAKGDALARGDAQGRSALIREELVRASLRGRGGAGFPAGLKEGSAAAAWCDDGCERYVVCNADEGEPGTFKDRIIMETSPFLLVEGMVVSALSIDAHRGYVYIRGEYGTSIDRVGRAITAAREAGYLGPDILGSGFAFDIELKTGAGSYLCGEELTLIESLEGKRGYPRIKPPFPAESGLWGRPTLVNNVETLAALPWIMERGVDAWLALGRPGSPGTKVFCLSGDFLRPGYGEWELGTSLGSLVEAAGGLTDSEGKACPAGRLATAYLLGGAAGCFVPGDSLDLAMDYDSLKAWGASLGSGAVVAIGPDRRLAPVIASIMDFFAHESCGKCVPCRVGTADLARKAGELERASRAGEGQTRLDAILDDMVGEAELMAKSSLCPLGQSPILPLKSAARKLRGRL